MEDQLKEEVLLHSIFESSLEGILVLDNQETVLMANTVCEQLFGYQKGELTKKNIKDLIYENLKEILQNIEIRNSKNTNTKILDNGMRLTGFKKNDTIFFLDSRINITPINGKSVTIIFLKEIDGHVKNIQELKAQNIWNKAVLKALPDLIFIFNKEGIWLDIHAPDPSLLLKPKNELLGKSIFNTMPKALCKKFVEAIKESDKINGSVIFEYSLTLNNILKTFEARVVAKDNGNHLAIIRDISEKRRAEENLMESETQNMAIVQALPDMVTIHDKNGTVLDLLSKGPLLYIQPLEDIIGKKVMEVFPNKDGNHIIKAFAKADRTKTMQTLEINLPLLDRSVDFEVRIVPLEEGKLLTFSRDITHKRAVQNILDMRNMALEVAGSGIVIIDAKLSDIPIIYCNDAFCQLTGHAKNEVLGENCRFLQNGDRNQAGIGTMRSAIEKGEPCKVVLRNYQKDGTLFWNEITLTPLHNRKGKLTHFIGVLNDVTWRKKEVLLKDQIRKILEYIIERESLEEIGNEITETICGQIEDCMASILLFDKVGNTLHTLASSKLPGDFIKGMEGLCSGPKAASCGTAAFLKKEVESKDIANDPLWENHREIALQNGIKSSISFPILSSKKDVLGTCAVYWSNLRSLLGTEREILTNMVQLAGVAIDQHNVRLKLQKNREKLEGYAQKLEHQVENRTQEINATVEELVNTNKNLHAQILSTESAEKKAMTSQALFVAIAKNFPKGAIIVFNEEMELVAYEGEEVRKFDMKRKVYDGQNVDEISVLDGTQKKILKEQIRKTLSGQKLTFEVDFQKNIYSVNSSPLYFDDKIKWALFIYSNVTVHRKVEEEIQKTLEQEKKLNELKSRFVAMASHEFRTPLSVILSSAILIGKQNEPNKENQREKYVDRIKNSVRSLSIVLDDFLSLDKLEEGKVVPCPEHFDIVQFSKSLIREIGNIKKEGQSIILNSDASEIPVTLDPKMLRYIYMNLMTNAIKYSDENQDIIIEVSRKGNALYIKVMDWGIGIPSDEHKHMYNVFFRAKNALNIQGTGLGLHIVKQYVSIMGGSVNFVSEVDKGTTFTVELPMDLNGE